MALMPRAAAANAQGGNVYMRLGPSVKDNHPGVVMLDDLAADAVEQLHSDGLEPFLVVETSTGNFQVWIRLVAGSTVPYATVGLAARHLASAYDGDERAVSPRQPGRLPGFTNRKPKHQQAGGRFPFVRLVRAEPGLVASAGWALLNGLSPLGTAGAAAGAAPETPRTAACAMPELDPGTIAVLDAIYIEQRDRILREAAAGRRPAHAVSASEMDFATARVALAKGLSRDEVAAWLATKRDDKDTSYPARTVVAASTLCPGRLG